MQEAVLYVPSDQGTDVVRCLLCPHRCIIAHNGVGRCGVRKNLNGTLYSLGYGKIVAQHVDPIEKKPLYHFLPGSLSYSIATPGCNFTCTFCQNWHISQLREADFANFTTAVSPEDVVAAAKKYHCRSISCTYTEPTIYFEYAYDVARLAQKEGIHTILVTNGFMSKDAIDRIRPYISACNVDLKSFRDDFYSSVCGGRLQPVCESISHMKMSGLWIEVTTLLIPGKNDSDAELQDMATFIASVSTDIPWHISRFSPNYKMYDSKVTPVSVLEKAKCFGSESGLKHVYLGNVMDGNDTICPGCGTLLIQRSGFCVEYNAMREDRCSACDTIIPGLWS